MAGAQDILFAKRHMKIAGVQKLTTLDYPGHLAATIFLPGCDLRCGYCHNPDLVLNRTPTQSAQSSLSAKDVLAILREQRSFIDAVCITGGEPLLSLDPAFVREIKAMGFKIKIDTNGFHPQELKALVDEKLVDYVAVDIKTLPTLYQGLVGRKPKIADLMQTVRLVTTLPAYEFRTTVIPGYHSVELIESMVNWLRFTTGQRRLRAYYLQQFVPRPGCMLSPDFDKLPHTPHKMLDEYFEKVKEFFCICEVRKYYEEVPGILEA